MLKFYNTLTRKKEDFKPLEDNEVRIYSCGPTVYDYAHLGNLRAYIFSDVLRRVLGFAGYRVKQVMNITDVGHLTSDADEGEDKIEKGARREKKSPQEIADFYTKAFLSDLKKLNIEIPKLLPKATDHIKEMIEMIKKIEKKGYAYQADDGVYFDTSKLKNYGQLSRQKTGLERKSRIPRQTRDKKHPTDFALWLKAVGRHKNHLQTWDSSWGKGFPGWHIECSAMSEKYLGKKFDIHTGGVDHIPVHHENEIAQSAAANNVIPARFWLHSAFLLVDKEKMAKSENNFLTLSDIEKKGFNPLDFRFLCLINHYQSPMIFNQKRLKAASAAFSRLKEIVSRLNSIKTKKVGLANCDKRIKDSESKIKKYFFDDLNIPLVLGQLFLLGHYLSQNIERLSQQQAKKVISIFREANQVLALDLLEEKKDGKIMKKVQDLAELRQEARLKSDYKKADGFRKLIEREGYKIEDLKDNRYRII